MTEMDPNKGPIATSHENLGICLLQLFLAWKFGHLSLTTISCMKIWAFVSYNYFLHENLSLEIHLKYENWFWNEKLAKEQVHLQANSTSHMSMDETLLIWVGQLSHNQYEFQPKVLNWRIQVRTSVSTINPGLTVQPKWESWCDVSRLGLPSPIFQSARLNQ